MLIPVFSGKADTHNVCNELLNRGLLAMVTSRTHAMQIAYEVKIALGINTDSEEAPFLIHLSTDVDKLGWFDFLIYSKVYVYEPGKTEEYARVSHHTICKKTLSSK